MLQDYRRGGGNREIFPRDAEYNTNRLICGHLNRLKFPPDVDNYLKSRKEGMCMMRSIARANRCFCRREDIAANHHK
jgi:hypothetical protein